MVLNQHILTPILTVISLFLVVTILNYYLAKVKPILGFLIPMIAGFLGAIILAVAFIIDEGFASLGLAIFGIAFIVGALFSAMILGIILSIEKNKTPSK